MTKEQLEEKIKNEGSVWVVYQGNIIKIKLDKAFLLKESLVYNSMLCPIFGFDLFYSTKAQAQHYLNNGSVTRIEMLPYVTWEEFKNGKEIEFIEPKGENVQMFMGDYICVWLDYSTIFRERATEENFYKAYDIIRKLFRGIDL